MANASTAVAAWPGPRLVPFIGRRVEQLRWSRDPVRYLKHTYRTFGSVSAWPTQPPRLFVFGPEHNQLLTRQRDRFLMLPPSAVGRQEKERAPSPEAAALTCLRSGLLALDGEEHRRHRQVVAAGFRRTELARHHDRIVADTGRTLDDWRIGETMDVERALRELVHRLALGTIVGGRGDANARLAALVERFVATAPRAMIFPVALPSTSYSRLLRLADQIVAALEDAIAGGRDRPRAHSALDRMVRLNERSPDPLTRRELVAEAYNVLCHETTASALTWTLLLLAQHPSSSEELDAEIRGTLGGTPPTVGDLDRLPVLDNVIKESLRLLPPAPFMRRFVAEPCEIGGGVAPVGSRVFFSQLVTHHMPDVFPHPDRFVPGRWEDHRPTPVEYFPFGIGPHGCVAGRFAMMEMRIVLAMLVQRYRLTPPVGTRVDHWYALSLRPRNGLPMRVAEPSGKGGATRIHGTVRSLVELD